MLVGFVFGLAICGWFLLILVLLARFLFAGMMFVFVSYAAWADRGWFSVGVILGFICLG